MENGEAGANGAPAVKPVEKEQKPEQGNVTHQLQAMEANIVLEVKPKHNNVTHIAVVKISGPHQNARIRESLPSASRPPLKKTLYLTSYPCATLSMPFCN